jgi:hypothetical protein
MACGLLVDLNLICVCQLQQSPPPKNYRTVGIIFSVPYKTPTGSDSLDYKELLLDMSHERSQAHVEYVNTYKFSLNSLNHYNAKFITGIVFFKF